MDDLRSGRDGARVMRVDVGHDDVGALRADAADLRAASSGAAELVVARAADHDHAVPERQLRVRDGAVLAGDHEVALEAEGAAQPLDGGGRRRW